MIKCPCCGERAWAESWETGNSFSVYCSACGWNDDMGYPMTPESWVSYLSDGWEVGHA